MLGREFQILGPICRLDVVTSHIKVLISPRLAILDDIFVIWLTLTKQCFLTLNAKLNQKSVELSTGTFTRESVFHLES